MYVNLFKKEGADYTRYWISVSTEIYDAKKKKGSGDYVNASMPVRLGQKALDVFKENAVKTKGKKITGGRFVVKKWLLEAVHPKDDDYAYVRFVILEMEPAPERDD